MEYCDYGDLGRYLHKNRQLHEQEIRHFFVQAKNGLKSLLLSKGSLASTTCGTPYYMAPEILIGKLYNEKADLWSFGMMIYECLSGPNFFRDT
uniref:Protein kinase domain-containing protein n=1 Tax=Acrobeloides nanus TaxID=290746 RepID=A0A914C9N2_9BILA